MGGDMKEEFRKWIWNRHDFHIFLHSIFIGIFYFGIYGNLFAIEKKIEIGKNRQNHFEGTFNSHINYSKNLLKLKKQSPILGKDKAELIYLNFDNKIIQNTGNVLYDNYKNIKIKGSIDKVASFEKSFHKIIIKPSDSSFLRENRFIEHFNILFLLKSYKFKQTATILSKIHYLEGKKYGILCELVNGKIKYSFYHIFYRGGKSIPEVSITSRSNLNKIESE